MEKNLSSPLIKALIYVGIILGAGFASGAEILAYFADFGDAGFFGLILASALFALVGWAIWYICTVKGISDYQSFMDITMGVRFAKIMEAVLGFFMFVVFAAMLAAMGSALNESFGFEYLLSISIVAAICFVTFLFGISGIIKLNAYISPLLIVGCTLIGFLTFAWSDRPAFAIALRSAELLRSNWYISAVTYVGYNIIGAVVILPSLICKTKKEALKPALFSGVILLVLGFSIFISLLANHLSVAGVQIPLLALVLRHGPLVTYIFMLLFLAACFTTAATNGYAVAATISGRYKVNEILLKALISLLGVLAALAGFSNFVRVIYPIFAVAGVIEIILIIKYFVTLIVKSP